MALKALPNAFPKFPKVFPKPGNCCCCLLNATRQVSIICPNESNRKIKHVEHYSNNVLISNDEFDSNNKIRERGKRNPYHYFHCCFGEMSVSVLVEGFFVGGLWLLGYFLTSFIAVLIQGIPRYPDILEPATRRVFITEIDGLEGKPTRNMTRNVSRQKAVSCQTGNYSSSPRIFAPNC
jgi:hypothetical protein